MPTSTKLGLDPKPRPGRPRFCHGCGARHPYAGGRYVGYCGACVHRYKAYQRAAAVLLAAPPEQLYRAERPAKRYAG